LVWFESFDEVERGKRTNYLKKYLFKVEEERTPLSSGQRGS